MSLLEILPNPVLRPWIKRYTYLLIDCDKRRNLFPNGSYRLPDTTLRMAFHFSQRVPWIETIQGNIQQPAHNVRGYQENAFVFNTRDEIEVLTVEFMPFGFQYIFDLPPSELNSNPTHLSNLTREDTDQLVHELSKKKNFLNRTQFLDQYFKKKIAYKKEDENALKVYQLIHANNQMSVNTLASQIFMSERTLHRFFLKHYGLSPKSFLRLFRFERTIKMLQFNPEKNLADLAASNGYFDQAHFSGEIKYFSGLTPLQLKQMLQKTISSS